MSLRNYKNYVLLYVIFLFKKKLWALSLIMTITFKKIITHKNIIFVQNFTKRKRKILLKSFDSIIFYHFCRELSQKKSESANILCS